MPINSEMSGLYPEKFLKSVSASSASAVSSPGAVLTTTGTPSSSSSGMPNKGNGQSGEVQPALVSSNANKAIDNSLIKHQGQKWQQYFDFEKMLKHIRIAEKHLRNKNDTSGGSNSNGKSPTSSNVSVSTPKVVNAPSLKCGGGHKQVQRLNGNDMHYYGIVPKQTAIDVIVCSVCRGIYTKVGLNNHMMLQHPSVWSAVSTKLASSAGKNEAFHMIVNDNSQDCIRDGTTTTEIVGSPSDLSGIMSTSSNASTSSSMSSSTYTTTPRHKGSKAASAAGSSSSSTSGGRSRSKQSKHSSSSAASSVHVSTVSSETGPTPTSKSSKKSSSTNATTAPAAVVTQASVSASSTEYVQPITIYSSSSNSSCSLPPTPKMGTTIVAETSAPVVPAEEVPHAAPSLPNDLKEKLATESSATVSHSKKKVKSSTTFAGHESVVESSSTSSSSGEFDHATSGSTTSSKTPQVPFAVDVKETVGAIAAPMGVKAVGNVNCFEVPISELDQAVSSITGGQEDVKNNTCIEDIVGNSLNVVPRTYQMQPAANPPDGNDKLQTGVSSMPAGMSMLAQSYGASDMAQTTDEIMPHNTSNDNSMLNFEDMLDSKFINDILNTVESEMHFDENELDTAAQQTFTQPQHPPAAKRMRYDESVITQSHQSSVSGVPAEYGSFQQQQQQQQPPQQYGHFEGDSMENIKVFGNATHPQPVMEAQYQAQDQQHQITTIDAMQLQQLLYQQQNLNVYEGGIDPTTGALQQQTQFDQNGVVNAKHLIDLCSADDLQKSKAMGLGEYAAMSSMGNTFEGNACGDYDALTSHFQLFNVPSLTDDVADEVDMLVRNVVDNEPRNNHHQYVLPSNEEHLIYEITDNNQVAVMSQQRQQQVIAEFLTQANYESLEHINSVGSAENMAVIAQSSASALALVNNDDVSELMDFDFHHIDVVKSLTGNSSSSGGAITESKPIKTERESKYCDDFYFNVYFYAGIPRPLVINCFGLVKLPLAAATTFRKHLLTTRKANNSPITLSGGINGIVGSSGSTGTTRLGNVNAKNLPSYFSSLSGGGSSACNTVMGNEFSIGSITITNSPLSQQQLYSQAKQSGMGNGSGNGPLEVTFNTTTNGSAASPVSSLHRSRSTSKANNTSTSTTLSSGRNKSQNGGCTPIAVVTPTSRLNARPNVLTQTAKTIYVSSTPSNINDRIKILKHGAFLACKAEVSRKQQFSSRQIADILGNVGKNSTSPKQPLPLQQNSTTDNGGTETALVDEQIRLNRVNHFYERRRKLLDLTCNARRITHDHQLTLHEKQRLAKQPPFSRLFSDCSNGSGTIETTANCKSSNSTSSNGANDAMRIFA